MVWTPASTDTRIGGGILARAKEWAKAYTKGQ
jgi:hypothetical protein